MPDPVAYFEMGGPDAAALQDFYAGLFGWSIEGVTSPVGANNYYFVSPAEGGIPGGIMQTGENMPPNYLMVYVRVDDLQASLDKAVSLGAEALLQPFTLAGNAGSIAVFRDPAGNVLGLHKG